MKKRQGAITYHVENGVEWERWTQYFSPHEKEVYDCILRNKETFQSIHVERAVWFDQPTENIEGLFQEEPHLPPIDERKLEEALRRSIVSLDIE